MKHLHPGPRPGVGFWGEHKLKQHPPPCSPPCLLTGELAAQVGEQRVHVPVLRRLHHFRRLLHPQSLCRGHNRQL